jgi:hypothetical protein
MKIQILKVIGGALLMLFMTAGMSAQAKHDQEQLASQGLVGSWNLEVTIRDCETGTPIVSFLAMNTYNQGGTMQQTAVPAPDGSALPGHGVWNHSSGRSYAGAFQFFNFGPGGVFAGRVIVRSAINLAIGGDEYTSTDTAEIFDPNGTFLFRSCSTSTATRFR